MSSLERSTRPAGPGRARRIVTVAMVLFASAITACGGPSGLNVYEAGELGLTLGVDVIALNADGSIGTIGLILEPDEVERFNRTLDESATQTPLASCADQVLLRFNRSDGFIIEMYVVDCGPDGRWLTGFSEFWDPGAVPLPPALADDIDEVLAAAG